MPIHAYDLVVNNFRCPSFHSCTLMDSLYACERQVRKGGATLCQNVSTHFVNLISHSNGKRSWYEATNLTHPGPDKVMALFHNEALEKTYNYVAENSLYLTAAGIGAIAVGFLAYRAIEKFNRTPESLKNIELSDLPSLLQRAEVGEDEIYLEGESESVSYRQVSNAIERLYSNSVRFMRQKQNKYIESNKTAMLLANLIVFIICPLFAHFPRPPTLNHYEEARVRSAMQIRERAYAQLNNLLDTNGSVFQVLTRIWNNTISKLGIKPSDSKLLEEMVSRRKGNESIKPNLEWGSKDYAEGRNLQSRVVFAAATIEGIVILVAHVAQMAFYSCFVFSKVQGETVALVAKDAFEDLDNIRTAALGIFSPETVPGAKAKETIVLY